MNSHLLARIEIVQCGMCVCLCQCAVHLIAVYRLAKHTHTHTTQRSNSDHDSHNWDWDWVWIEQYSKKNNSSNNNNIGLNMSKKCTIMIVRLLLKNCVHYDSKCERRLYYYCSVNPINEILYNFTSAFKRNQLHKYGNLILLIASNSIRNDLILLKCAMLSFQCIQCDTHLI